VIVLDAVSPLNAVLEVARVMVGPLWREPTGPIEVSAAVRYVAVSTESVPSPLMVLTNPLEVRFERREMFCVVLTVNALPEYVSPVPAVVVPTHVGTPETNASTWPFVPAEVVASLFVPFPKRTVFACIESQPVPPLRTARMPETWLVRFRVPAMVASVDVAALYTFPRASMASPPRERLVRLRKPNEEFVDEAYTEERLVEEELVVVSLPAIDESPVTASPPEETVSVVGVVIAPVLEIVVVAVLPKYARYAESCVEEALWNCWSADQLLLFPRLSPTVLAVPPL
jgi:hypothetical protein